MYLSGLMAQTVISRRIFLKNTVRASALASAGSLFACGGKRQNEVALLSAAKGNDGKYFAVLLNSNLDILSKLELPRRGHAAVFNKNSEEALFFSRRPGDEIFVFRKNATKIEKVLKSEPGRHFYGHGVLTQDSGYLLTTENKYDSGQGIVVVRDALDNYKVVSEIASGGVGPHELALLSDGKTIVVANGGLRTHPEKNRIPLNTDTMQPNISFIDLLSGDVLNQYSPPHHQMSLRHMSVDAADNVYVGVQYMGGPLDDVPLVVRVQRERGMTSLAAPENYSVEQKHYTASVCEQNGGVLVTCPKSSKITLWANDELQDTSVLKDVAGACKLRHSQQLVFSSGAGEIGFVHVHNKKIEILNKKIFDELRWDNHLIAV